MVKKYSDSGDGGAHRATTALLRFAFLEDLHLRGLDCAGLMQLLPALARSTVTRLAFPRGSFCPDASLLPSPTAACGAGLLSRLTKLDLTGCDAFDDATLEWCASAAPNLEELRVSCNAKLARPFLVLPKLRVAALYICANLEDAAVDQLCRASPLLVRLRIYTRTHTHARHISISISIYIHLHLYLYIYIYLYLYLYLYK